MGFEELVDPAFEALSRPRDEKGEIEYDLVDGEPWDIQLRKGCRYLKTAEHCLDGPNGQGYYTGAVELSLCAIERTLQALLMEYHGYRVRDFHDHGYTLIEARERGLLDEAAALALQDLWGEFRSENYYRLGVPDRHAAEAVLEMARALHDEMGARKAAYRGACQC